MSGPAEMLPFSDCADSLHRLTRVDEQLTGVCLGVAAGNPVIATRHSALILRSSPADWNGLRPTSMSLSAPILGPSHFATTMVDFGACQY